MVISGRAPRTILGTVVAAVALRLVPKLSAAMVTKIAQKPVLKPRAAHTQYMVVLVAPFKLKNAINEITDNP